MHMLVPRKGLGTLGLALTCGPLVSVGCGRAGVVFGVVAVRFGKAEAELGSTHVKCRTRSDFTSCKCSNNWHNTIVKKNCHAARRAS